MKHTEALKMALAALELVNLEFVCGNGSHHAKKDRHEWDEDCPITDRWREAIIAIKEALAQPYPEAELKAAYAWIRGSEKIIVDQDASLKLALEALELSHPRFGIGTAIHIKAVAVIKEALAQPEYRAVKTYHEGKPVYVAQPQQEPFEDLATELFVVVQVSPADDGFSDTIDRIESWLREHFLATPQRKPLTEFERMQIIGQEFPLPLVQSIVIQKIDLVCKAIEAAHGIKE